MTDPDAIRFSCPSPEDVITYSHSFSAKLPSDLKSKFRTLFNDYHLKYRTTEELYQRLNGRTLSEILAEMSSETSDLASPSETGQVDGVGYELYKAPSDKPADQSGDASAPKQ